MLATKFSLSCAIGAAEVVFVSKWRGGSGFKVGVPAVELGVLPSDFIKRPSPVILKAQYVF
jgi:hypothetical protein